MGSLFEQITLFYLEAGWAMAKVPDEPILSAQYGGENGLFVFVVTADQDQATLSMFARLPEACPPQRLDELRAFMNRSNFGMTAGSWCVDVSDGEVRFRLGIQCRGVQLSDEWLQRATLYTCLTMDRFQRPLLELLAGNASADDVYDEVYRKA